MPEGYGKILTPNEIADIVAYLKADVSRPAGFSQPTGEQK
jgi:mono/diheme cytochrome c family protein